MVVPPAKNKFSRLTFFRLHRGVSRPPATPGLRHIIFAGLLAISILAHKATAQEPTYYRITNESGKVELKATLTPEEAKRGYSIVTPGGKVIKEVAPQLTEEEYAAQSFAKRAAEQARLEQEARQAYDEALLLRYSNVDDLLAEKKRKLSEFDIRISILYSNLAGLKEKLDIQQGRAANIERRGSEVPDSIVTNIEDLESEMRELEATIKLRQAEKENVSEKYDRDAMRLEALSAEFKRQAQPAP